MQQYDQRRLRLFAVVLFLGIMAANLGRYLIFDGLYLWDARLRWQECAYVLHGLNPFDVMLPWGAQCPGPMCWAM